MSDLGLSGGINENRMRIGSVRPGTFPPRPGLSDTRVLSKTDMGYGARAELARYEMDQLLGHGTVPDVAELDDDHGAFVMRWVDDAGFGGQSAHRANGSILTDGQLRSFCRIAMLDAILGNYDRHRGNYLVDDENDTVWAIDNEFGHLRSSSVSDGLADLPHHLDDMQDYDLDEIREMMSDALVDIRASLPGLLAIAAERLPLGLSRFGDNLDGLEKLINTSKGWEKTSRYWPRL